MDYYSPNTALVMRWWDTLNHKAMKKILLIAILVLFSFILSSPNRVLLLYAPLGVDGEISEGNNFASGQLFFSTRGVKGVGNQTETRLIYASLPQYDLLVGVEGNNDILNDHLLQNYPKPFRSAITLSYIIEKSAAGVINFINITEQMILMRVLKTRPGKSNSFSEMPKNCPQEYTVTEYIPAIKSEEAK